MTCALFSLTAISVVDLQLPGEEEEPARSDEHASPRAQGAIGSPVTIRAATWPARRQSGGPAAGEVTWAGASGGSLAW
jgi:hypothetical protein